MKKWTTWTPPVLLFCLILFLLAICSGSQNWPESPAFRNVPYVLFGVAILLGAAFSQSRVSFVSLLLASVVFATNRSFAHLAESRGPVVVLLATIYVPLLIAIFRHLHEAGVLTKKGFGRTLLVSSSAIMIIALPEFDFFRKGIVDSDISALNPLSGRLQIPGIGLLACGLSIPVLLLRREHENHRVGPAMAFTLFFVFAALNFRSMWFTKQAQTVFLAFMSGAALVLIWYVLQSSWHEAYMDELTELPGRRSMKRHFARLEQSFSIAVVDVDHFKAINDKYGHSTGDQVLRFIASRLEQNKVGKPYRYGGEEFVIVSENDSYDDTIAGLEDLRCQISGRKFMLRSKHRPRKKPARSEPPKEANMNTINVTVSIGVAKWSNHCPHPGDVLEAADKALYKAKDEGRDCVRTA